MVAGRGTGLWELGESSRQDRLRGLAFRQLDQTELCGEGGARRSKTEQRLVRHRCDPAGPQLGHGEGQGKDDHRVEHADRDKGPLPIRELEDCWQA